MWKGRNDEVWKVSGACVGRRFGVRTQVVGESDPPLPNSQCVWYCGVQCQRMNYPEVRLGGRAGVVTAAPPPDLISSALLSQHRASCLATVNAVAEAVDFGEREEGGASRRPVLITFATP